MTQALNQHLIAPRRPQGARGVVEVPPWDYRVTVVIPHHEGAEELAVALALLRLQTVHPYLVIVDTGSSDRVRDQLESWRASDLEIHYVRAHAYRHPSAPVTTAMDVGFALCRTDLCMATHADVFAARRDWLEWLLGQCSADAPVVGWEMSPRQGDEWRGCPSHSATVYHMPTMRRIGATWSMERYYDGRTPPDGGPTSWPDTESTLYACLRAAGVPIRLLGPERNWTLDQGVASYIGDERVWHYHARSLALLRLYGDAAQQDLAIQRGRQAVAEGWERARLWMAEG